MKKNRIYYDKNIKHTADLNTDEGTIAVDVKKATRAYRLLPDLLIIDVKTRQRVCTYL